MLKLIKSIDYYYLNGVFEKHQIKFRVFIHDISNNFSEFLIITTEFIKSIFLFYISSQKVNEVNIVYIFNSLLEIGSRQLTNIIDEPPYK